MRLLITGGLGFIGRRVAAYALDANVDVALLARPARALPDHLASARVFRGTMAEPPWAAIRAFAPTSILHAAWISTPHAYVDSEENLSHLEWGERFFRKILETRPASAMALGSCAEYRWQEGRLAEDAPLAPTSRYALCKSLLHERVAQMCRAASVPFCWGRVFYPYGRGEPPGKLCSTMARRLLARGCVSLNSPWSVKDYIHVDDLARAILIALQAQYDGPLNLGTGTGVTLAALVDEIARLAGVPPVAHGAGETRRREQTVADIGRLRALGFEPEIELKTGLGELVESIRNEVGRASV